MTIEEAIYKMTLGVYVRNENFAAGTYCWIDSDGNIDDPEAGIISETEFREYYRYFQDGWYEF